MLKIYKSIKWIKAHRDMRMPMGDAGPNAREVDDPDLKALNARMIGAYLKNDRWMVDVKFGNRRGRGIFPGHLEIDRDTNRLFVRLIDFLGNRPKLFLEPKVELRLE